ncbi:aminoglycoside phosphotransferase family protein [Nocardioides sp. 1609]|uniref:aminoglycoside phosphotransferase family protein n=1 Tax=Nocardioides sp. 1609 TaxID=2508327 RepID=UPI00106FC56E|nr:aminoglycoside phosphotransferase family protein [Nocardioides sp. 1609]
MSVALPPGVQALAARGPDWAAWVDRLPRLVRDLLAEWALTVDGEPLHRGAALVLPVRDGHDRAAVLKVQRPDDESEHEHLALQHWHGDGAALLLRADPHRAALLLERLHPVDLTDHWDLEACEVVAGLYARLHVPAPPRLRPLTAHVERWTTALADLPRDAPVPHRMVEQAVALGRGFLADPASTGTMIHSDLHYGTVLAADREPWLAIDPRPLSGDPHYEVAPLLWNRWDELDGDVRGGVRRRFHTTVDAAGLDEDRARDWVVVRVLGNVVAALGEREPDGDWITRCVSIAKAVQD